MRWAPNPELTRSPMRKWPPQKKRLDKSGENHKRAKQKKIGKKKRLEKKNKDEMEVEFLETHLMAQQGKSSRR